MNQPNTPPGLSLPSPAVSAEATYGMPGGEGSVAEVRGVQQEMAATPPPQPAVQQPLYAQPLTPVTSAVPFVPAQPPAAASPATIAPADDDLDDDSLDAEWVSKAKAIVEQTQSDPYKESRALSQVKAEYLQRRHGKELKVHDTK